MSEKYTPLVRPEAADRMSSPDHITDYLHVTKPHMWFILASALILLASLAVWASLGSLTTRAQVAVIVKNGEARLVAPGDEKLKQGMKLTVEDQETEILSVSPDEFGRSLALARLSLPDGSYSGSVVTGTTHPISYLLGNR